MFKSIDMATGNHQIRQAFKRLVRVIQTELEHKRVTNDSGVALVKGDVMYNTTTGDRTVNQAVADSEAEADWVGVMSEPVAIGGRGIMRTEGYALVRYNPAATGPSGNEGLPLFVSTVAGASSLDNDGTYTMRLGLLVDASDYDQVTYPYVYAFIGHCCDPVDVAQ